MEPTPPADVSERLSRYAALVREFATRVDLVSPRDVERFGERHIHDSLRAVALVDSLAAGPVADVGSGAGLPGIPLAIAGRRRPWRLLEPRARRAAFLEEVARDLDLECEVVRLTAQEAAADPRFAGAHIGAIARALAPPTDAFGLLMPLVRPGGAAIVFVGEAAKLPPEAGEWKPGIAIIRREEHPSTW